MERNITILEDDLGRKKTQGPCKETDCQEDAVARNWCRTHYDQWRHKYGHLRCQWPGCKAFQEDRGRRMGSGRDKKFYCRLHEVEHLRPTPEIEQLNLSRLASRITVKGNCWIASGPVMGRKGEYVGFDPEGANKVLWIFHRVVWDLLVGGHKPGYELDHLPKECSTQCCNPAHLEPVKRGENERRKRTRTTAVNWAAAETQAVKDFAEEHGFPLPVRAIPAQV